MEEKDKQLILKYVSGEKRVGNIRSKLQQIYEKIKNNLDLNDPFHGYLNFFFGDQEEDNAKYSEYKKQLMAIITQHQKSKPSFRRRSNN